MPVFAFLLSCLTACAGALHSSKTVESEVLTAADGVRNQVKTSAFNLANDLEKYKVDFRNTAFATFLTDIFQPPRDATAAVVWLNLGAGDAVAERELLAALTPELSRAHQLKVVSVGYDGPQSDRTKRVAWENDLDAIHRRLGPGTFEYIETNGFMVPAPSQPELPGEAGFFYNVPDNLIPAADIITDQRGVNSFTLNFSENLEKTLRHLKQGGRFVGTLPADPGYFEILSEQNTLIDPSIWFRTIRGAHLIQFRLGERASETRPFRFWIVELERTSAVLNVPHLDLVSVDDRVAPPPKRTFRVAKD